MYISYRAERRERLMIPTCCIKAYGYYCCTVFFVSVKRERQLSANILFFFLNLNIHFIRRTGIYREGDFIMRVMVWFPLRVCVRFDVRSCVGKHVGRRVAVTAWAVWKDFLITSCLCTKHFLLPSCTTDPWGKAGGGREWAVPVLFTCESKWK